MDTNSADADLLRQQAREIDRLRCELAQRPVTVEIEESPPVEYWNQTLASRSVEHTTVTVRLTDDVGRVFELSPSTVRVIV